MTSTRYITDALLEQYLAEELDATQKARIEAALADSPGDRERLDELRADTKAFLLEHPALPKEREVREQLVHRQVNERATRLAAGDTSGPALDFAFPAQSQSHPLSGSLAREEVSTLYRQHAGAVHRRALHLLGSTDEAMDVTQDTFLEFMRAESSLHEGTATFATLYELVTYKAVDRLRRRARWSGTLSSLDIFEEDEPAASQSRTSHDGGLDRVNALRDLAILTEGETPETLTAAVLYFVEGYSLEEVGQMLNSSRRTLSELLHAFVKRARKRRG